MHKAFQRRPSVLVCLTWAHLLRLRFGNAVWPHSGSAVVCCVPADLCCDLKCKTLLRVWEFCAVVSEETGTHPAGLLTRWPGCRIFCLEAAPTLRSRLQQWTCSWCWGEDWPRSPFFPSGPPAEAQSRHLPRTARTASRRTSGTPRCRSDQPGLLCRTVGPTLRSAWTASGCRPNLAVVKGALEGQEWANVILLYCYSLKEFN